jgi:ketosteroid isomerase-like protein
MDRPPLTDWLQRYERAWRTPGTDVLAELFTEDASYSGAPYEDPQRGLAAIQEMWEAERRAPDEEFEMSSEVIAVEGDTGVVRVEVHYGPPQDRDYRDLWIVRLDEGGLCSHFEEWPFWPADQDGSAAAGTV